MNLTFLLIIGLLVALAVTFSRMRRTATQSHVPASRSAKARAPSPARHTPAARTPTPRLEALQWHEPVGPAPVVPAAPAAPAIELDTRHARIRDRYIAARFPGVFRGSADLLESGYVVKVARHFFEEGHVDRAYELLSLAIEESQAALPLRLARLEIAFLARDVTAFTLLARHLQSLHPGIPEWADVMRLGRAIAPAEPLFGAGSGDRSDAHYGPWPAMPNWIQASWDLTHEVLAADFHRAMSHRLECGNTPALSRVA
jgi:hypothetical protein